MQTKIKEKRQGMSRTETIRNEAEQGRKDEQETIPRLGTIEHLHLDP